MKMKMIVKLGAAALLFAGLVPLTSAGAQTVSWWGNVGESPDYYLQTPSIDDPREDAMGRANTNSFQENAADQRYEALNGQFWRQHDRCCAIYNANPFLEDCPPPSLQAVQPEHPCHPIINENLRGGR